MYSGKISDEVYLPEGSGMRVADQRRPGQAPVGKGSKAERIRATARWCTRPTALPVIRSAGTGITHRHSRRWPSQTYLKADKVRAIKTVTGGLEWQGRPSTARPIDGVMPAWDLPDEDIANVLTYVYNSTGAIPVEDVTPADVKANRVKAN